MKHGAWGLALRPDGKLLAVADTERFDHSPWDGIKTFDLPARTLRSHRQTPSRVVALAFSPDGQTLATARKDSPVIQLWEGRPFNEGASSVGKAPRLKPWRFIPRSRSSSRCPRTARSSSGTGNRGWCVPPSVVSADSPARTG